MNVYVVNSFLYAAVVLVAQLFINSLAAYAFARVDFPGREMLFLAVLATLMLPGSVTLIPTFLIAHKMSLTNTFWGVVLPGFVGAFGIFLLRQFFLNIPRELEQAARIDGCGFFGIYWRIMLPLAKPAIITLGVFIFLSEWSSFVWPLIVLSDWKKYPVTVGIALFRDVNSTNWPAVFAGSTIVSFPIIFLFLIAQKYIIGGISLSGLKG
jgi:multiple sugar transport system permease protein